jgi:integrase
MGVKVREKVKGSGEWWIFINHKGKRRSKKIGDKRAANAVKRKVEARLAKGDLGMIREQCPTLSVYGKQWLESPLRQWSDGTVKLYTTIFHMYIKKHLGRKRVDEIEISDVEWFLGKLDGLSSARKKNILAVLSGIFKAAVRHKIVKSNPCQNATEFCGNGTVRDIVTLTAEEVQTMLENAAALPIEAYTLFLVAVRTGLRIGELLGLRWLDLDFEGRWLEVNRTYYYHTKTYGPPKNKKTRKVDLTPASVEALRNLQAHRKVVSLDGDDLVFANTNGEPLGYFYLRDAIKRIAPKTITIHSLRHTYANLRIAKGDNVLDVSKQLGHHKVAFTIDKYGHWIPGEHKSQVDELDNLHLNAPHVHPEATNPHG